jgi:hypothetical protein
LRPALRAQSAIAISTPMKPPWYDMPPCQTMKISSGLWKKKPGR